MAQIFHPGINVLAKASIFGAVLLGAVVGLAATAFDHSPYQNQAGIVRNQPIPFSHEHHVSGLGIDCRYCHT
ncbi:MAG: cytochrome c3 family protein, partial [Phycisphaerae bacterium]|nr:cytochrome c3 family protein [Phycisphaerae bacterium]